MTKELRSPVGGWWKCQEAFLVLVVAVLVTVVSFLNPNFFDWNNIINVLQQISVVGIIAIGMGLVLINGEIDISSGTQVSVMGVVFAYTTVNADSVFFGLLAAFAAGMVMGLINGLLVVNLRAASFIITLGTQIIFHGAALVISQGYYFAMKGKFTTLGRGLAFGKIPNQIILFLIVILLAFLFLRFTNLGRQFYACGGNRKAAYVSGVRVKFNTIISYLIASGLYFLAAISLISQLGTAYPNSGDNYTMNALASTIVGGLSLSGGKGGALGMFLGVLIFGLISNAMNILNINAFWREVALGVIILAAVAISGLTEQKRT